MPVVTEDCSGTRFDWANVDLYRFFAFVFGSPSRERFDILAQPALKDVIADLWQRLGCAGECPDLVWFADYEEYEAAYIALFDVGIPEPPVPLFESAHDKTKPAQEVALENTWFYDVLGLTWDSSRGVPDYLITQLEFLAAVRYALENAPHASVQNLSHLERDFLDRHMLNWVPLASAKLARVSSSAFGSFMIMLANSLQNRRDEINQAASNSAS
jgi:DMSO reductase family type II enzyme chaperone